MTKKTIAYVEHPVSKDQKKKIRKDFDKIVDIRFAPKDLSEGDKLFPKPKTKAKAEPKAED